MKTEPETTYIDGRRANGGAQVAAFKDLDRRPDSSPLGWDHPMMRRRAGVSRGRFRRGHLWDRAGEPWSRVQEWVEPDQVRSLLDASVPWLLQWCGGELQWEDEGDPSVLTATVLPSLVTRCEAARLLKKKRVPTVFTAELWANERGGSLLLFHESGPAPRAESWYF